MLLHAMFLKLWDSKSFSRVIMKKANVLFDPKYLKVDKSSFANSESQNTDEFAVKPACL